MFAGVDRGDQPEGRRVDRLFTGVGRCDQPEGRGVDRAGAEEDAAEVREDQRDAHQRQQSLRHQG